MCMLLCVIIRALIVVNYRAGDLLLWWLRNKRPVMNGKSLAPFLKNS